MATLEKIRSKSVLLIIIIGVALLAFIIGDAITNSRNLFGDQSTVAKVGGNKIDYTDFVQKREELNSQLEMLRRQNPQQADQIDPQTLSQQALMQLISENLIDAAVEKAGIKTSDSQISYYIFDNPINVQALRSIMTALSNSGLAVQTPAQAYDIIFNPQNHGLTQAQMEPLQRMWNVMQNETAKMVARNSYQQLLSGTIRANNLDKKALHNDYISTRNIDVAFSPYNQLDPQKYVATEEAIRAEYENIKGRYKVDELTKDVAFIAVSVRPSEIDKNAATKLANETARAMASSSGISKDLKSKGIMVSPKEMLVKDLPSGPVKDYVTTASMDSVKIVQQGPKGFTIIKMKKRTTEIDSLQLNIVQTVGSLTEVVKARLNGGLAVDSLQTVFSADSVSGQAGQWITLYGKDGWTGNMDRVQVDSLLNAGGKYISLLNTPQASILAQLVKKSNPKEVVEFDEVTYELKPSGTTLNEQVEKFEAFLANNTTTKDFIANAAASGYNVNNMSLSASSPAIPSFGGKYYPDSRQVVRWVMIDGKPGKVSHIYESKDAANPMLYAIAVIDEYDDYKPLSNNEVNNFVTDRVRKSLAGDELVAKYKPQASSMANISKVMNVEAAKDSTFRFARNPKIRDAAVMGRIAGSKPGKVVVVKGDNGVYAYQILSTGTENFEYNDAQYDRQYNQIVSPDLIEMLKGGKTLKNNIYKFEAGD